MTAIRIHDDGGTDQLRCEGAPMPAIAPDGRYC
jgi:hypothetical protein